MATGEPGQSGRGQYVRNLTLAVVAGQVGCLTLLIVLGAVFGGLYLDARFDSKPLYTVILMLASIPVSLVTMLLVVRAAVKRIKPQPPQGKSIDQQEDAVGKRS